MSMTMLNRRSIERMFWVLSLTLLSSCVQAPRLAFKGPTPQPISEAEESRAAITAVVARSMSTPPNPPPVPPRKEPFELVAELQSVTDYVNFAHGDQAALIKAIQNTPGGRADTSYTWILVQDLDGDGQPEYLVSFPVYRLPTLGARAAGWARPLGQDEQPGFYCERPSFCYHLVVLFTLSGDLLVPRAGISPGGVLVWSEAPNLLAVQDLTSDGQPEVVIRENHGMGADIAYVGGWLNGMWTHDLLLLGVGSLALQDDNGNGLTEIQVGEHGLVANDPSTCLYRRQVFEWFPAVGSSEYGWVQLEEHQQIWPNGDCPGWETWLASGP